MRGRRAPRTLGCPRSVERKPLEGGGEIRGETGGTGTAFNGQCEKSDRGRYKMVLHSHGRPQAAVELIEDGSRRRGRWWRGNAAHGAQERRVHRRGETAERNGEAATDRRSHTWNTRGVDDIPRGGGRLIYCDCENPICSHTSELEVDESMIHALSSAGSEPYSVREIDQTPPPPKTSLPA